MITLLIPFLKRQITITLQFFVTLINKLNLLTAWEKYECCHFLSFLRCDWAGAISKTHASHFIGVSKHSKTIKALELTACAWSCTCFNHLIFPCLFSYAYFALFNFTMISIFFARKCTASPVFGNTNETLTLVFEVVRSVHSVLTIWNMLAHDCCVWD